MKVPNRYIRHCNLKSDYYSFFHHTLGLLNSLNLVSLQRTSSLQIHCQLQDLRVRTKTFQHNQASQTTSMHKLDPLEAEKKEERVKSFTSDHQRHRIVTLLETINGQGLQLILLEKAL